ncbi:MAG TPA: SpoIIE family protein phosphatase [Mycobacteriales bacterium]|nr:SpoIIE family protein phosphatase [Mycobacteriales bacterium]
MSSPGARPLLAVTLPPDGTSPRLARSHVRQVLTEAGHEALVDDALLMVTELVTNAVVHAGTVVQVDVVADAGGVRIEIGDLSPGGTPVVRDDADSSTREGGRGMFLLDALAEEWGTRHSRDGKSIWFRLGRPAPAVVRTRPSARPGATAATAAHGVPPALGWLLALPGDVETRLSPGQVLSELLHRLCDALDVEAAVLLVESDRDPDAWTVAASRGEEPDEEEVRELRRSSRTSDAVSSVRGRTTVLLRGRGGPFGALVLHAGPLDAPTTAIARLAAERLGMVLRDDRADVAQRRQRGALALLAEASDMFAATLDVQLAVTLATQLCVPRLAQWAAVFMVDDRGVRLASVSHEDEEGTSGLRVALSGSAGEAFAERLSRDLAVQRPSFVGRAEAAAVLGDGPRGDVLALPLVARRRLLGGLVVARPESGTYSAEDVSLLLDLGRRAALAVDNARLYGERTQIAHALQASLLPRELPSPAEAEFGARYHPAGEGNEVGGDFYDVFGLPGGGWAVAIGDVCGKGAEAAAITGLARNVVRLLVREGRAPSEVLRRLNDAVLELGERGRFCTAALALVQPTASGALDITYCSGGHPPPVLVPAGGAPRFVGRSGTVLGVVESPDLSDEQLQMAPGDLLVLYTDGVTERRNGRREFGDETLLRVLASTAPWSADAVAGRIQAEVRDFGPDAARDDLAVLVVRATGVQAPARPSEQAPQPV